MTTKHTPGPWRWDNGNLVAGGDEIEGYDIICKAEFEPVNANANGSLIAAAPELLEALKAAVGMLKQEYADRGQLEPMEIYHFEQAISKAEGGA